MAAKRSFVDWPVIKDFLEVVDKLKSRKFWVVVAYMVAVFYAVYTQLEVPVELIIALTAIVGTYLVIQTFLDYKSQDK